MTLSLLGSWNFTWKPWREQRLGLQGRDGGRALPIGVSSSTETSRNNTPPGKKARKFGSKLKGLGLPYLYTVL